MNEAETRAERIDPALRAAGWGVVDHSRVRREVIAPGRLVGNGRRAAAEFADYVQRWTGVPLGAYPHRGFGYRHPGQPPFF
jgi:type I restriction enzyme R subunit